jgi:hypothetical protein
MRVATGLSGKAFAAELGISAEHLSRMENGAKPIPRWMLLASRALVASSNPVYRKGANGQEVEILLIDGVKIEVDREISPIVRALKAAGASTKASCSGHGHRPGNIVLRDGREIIIARDFDEARKIDRLFPLDINGEPIRGAEIMKSEVIYIGSYLWPCRACGAVEPTPEGHDPCIANLPGVDFACCGHGRQPGYVAFTNGTVIRGEFEEFHGWRDPADAVAHRPRDRDGSGEAGQTASQAGPEGQQPDAEGGSPE